MPIHHIPGAQLPEDYNFDAVWSAALNASTTIRGDQHLDNIKKMGADRIAGLALGYQALLQKYAKLEKDFNELKSALQAAQHAGETGDEVHKLVGMLSAVA